MVTVASFVPQIANDLLESMEQEKKSVYINSGFLSNCAGSALLESGNELVISRIIIHPSSNSVDLLSVDCKSNPELGHLLFKAIRPCILFEDIPNSVIRIQVEVLNGDVEYNCINCVSIALVDANIPMLGLVTSHREIQDENNAFMVCCKDQVTNCSLDGELELFDQCYESSMHMKRLIVEHFRQKYD